MNIATLGSLNKKEQNDNDNNEYYAGGNDNRGGGSGLAVIGGDSNKLNEIVDRARGDQNISGSSSNSSTSRRITIYSNGFTVDDGPFRDMNDPNNAMFLNDLAKGHIPREFLNQDNNNIDQNEGINVALEDKRNQDYVPPPEPSYIAFGGEGKRMVDDDENKEINTNEIFDPLNDLDNLGEITPTDTSLPTTLLQIKLANGKKIKYKFNKTHTIKDIHRIINSKGGATQSYILMSGFPPKRINDVNLTLEEAGLISASISQSFT